MSGNCEEFIAGRKFEFTEFYDPASGLIVRFVREQWPNGKQFTYPVSEFSVRGRLVPRNIKGLFLGEDTASLTENDVIFGGSAYKEVVAVTESGMLLGAYDEFGFFEKTRELFRFPLSDVFRFLYCLGRWHPECENNAIIKWPDYIASELERCKIAYKVYSDHNAHEKPSREVSSDSDFLRLHGNPIVSEYGPGVVDHVSFVDEDATEYTLSLTLFRPGENERLRWHDASERGLPALESCPDCRFTRTHRGTQ